MRFLVDSLWFIPNITEIAPDDAGAALKLIGINEMLPKNPKTHSSAMTTTLPFIVELIQHFLVFFAPFYGPNRSVVSVHVAHQIKERCCASFVLFVFRYFHLFIRGAKARRILPDIKTAILSFSHSIVM